MADLKEDETIISCDNVSSTALRKNLVFYGRSKDIKIGYHFIISLVDNGEIRMEFCRCKKQLANIFTKPLSRDNFECLRRNFGVVDLDHD